MPSLRSHPGIADPTEPVYWAMHSFLPLPLTTAEQTFQVTLDSTAPKMLVYALGKHETIGDFNTRVPPTQPGFMVPDAGSLAAIAICTLIGFTLWKKRS